MVKTTIKEITEKFDKNGVLIERLTREEFIEDDEIGGRIISNPAPISCPFLNTIEPNTIDKFSWLEPYCNQGTIVTNAETTLKDYYSNVNTNTNNTKSAFDQAVAKCINTK